MKCSFKTPKPRLKTLDEINREYKQNRSLNRDSQFCVNHYAIVTAICLILAFLIIQMFMYNASEDDKPRSFLGFSALRVLSCSMQREIPQNSLAIIRQVDPQKIKLGDDITFFTDEKFTFTHRVINIHENHLEIGQRGFQTQGIENKIPDKEIVPADAVVGKVVFHSAVIGKLLKFFNENATLISSLCVFLLMLIAIYYLSLSFKVIQTNKCSDYYPAL